MRDDFDRLVVDAVGRKHRTELAAFFLLLGGTKRVRSHPAICAFDGIRDRFLSGECAVDATRAALVSYWQETGPRMQQIVGAHYASRRQGRRQVTGRPDPSELTP